MLLFPTKGAAIESANPAAYFFPCNLIYLAFAFFLEILEKRIVVTDRVDGIGKGMDVPIVYLDTVVENFGATTLFRDDRWSAALHGLERRDTKRLRNRRHNVNIAGLKAFVNLLAAHKSWEVETIGNSSLSCQMYHRIHHIA